MKSAPSVTTPPTTNKHLIRWVEKMAELTQPDHIHWVDGSKAEYDFLCERLVAAGTFTRLDQKKWPGCFYARSAPNDVASLVWDELKNSGSSGTTDRDHRIVLMVEHRTDELLAKADESKRLA